MMLASDAPASRTRSRRSPCFLLVDDDPALLRSLTRALRAVRPDWELRTARDGAEALVALEEQPFDAVLTDLDMPRMNGVQLLMELDRQYPNTVRLVHSAQIATMGRELVRYLAHNVLAKPADNDALIEMLAWALNLGGQVTRRVVENAART